MEILFKSTIINRNKIFDSLSNDDNFYLLYGSSTITREFSDVELPFRQNSNFFWLTGIDIPNCSIIINCNKNIIILVIPVYTKSHTIWNGRIPDFNIIKEKYKFNEIISSKRLVEFNFVCNKNLIKEIEILRIIKNNFEIDIMRESCRISSLIHNKIIYNKEVFIKKKEKLIINYFKYHTHNYDNVNNLAYPTIVGSGINSSILHYNSGNKIIKSKDTILIDGGCEYFNYASDITTTFPATKFDKYQQSIYDIVIKCNNICKNKIKSGIDFKILYKTAIEFIYESINNLGLINTSIQKEKNISNHRLVKMLMPHGLGHYIGLDVHDVGGSLNKNKGTILKENMVITIEPGIYFIRKILDDNLDLFNNITDYYHIGGIRIEDVVVVKINGFDQLNEVIR
tara:strand:- start:643 stop:1836 length:1194 start_codon:yes stop_codon:yes gene_type:complete